MVKQITIKGGQPNPLHGHLYAYVQPWLQSRVVRATDYY